MFAIRGNYTVSLSVVTVPACYLRYFNICFFCRILFYFLCFISASLSRRGEKIVRFSNLGSLFYVELVPRDLFPYLVLYMRLRVEY